MTTHETAANHALTGFAESIAASDWDRFSALLSPDFRGHLAHDDRRFDRDGFIAFNREYPGAWSFQLLESLAADTRAVGRSLVTGEGVEFTVATFLEVDSDGRILRLEEVWTDGRAVG